MHGTCVQLIDERLEVGGMERRGIGRTAVGDGIRVMVAPAVGDRAVRRAHGRHLVAPRAQIGSRSVDEDDGRTRALLDIRE